LGSKLVIAYLLIECPTRDIPINFIYTSILSGTCFFTNI